MTSQWNEVRIAELVRRWSAGQSASEIAEFLETSRGAVMGRIHRMGLYRPAHINHPEEKPVVTLPKTSV